MRRFLLILIILNSSISYADSLKSFCRDLVRKADSVKAIEGKDAWLFPFKEIQHLSKDVQCNVRAINAIEAYNAALAAEGIELLLVPVPPKALLYQEKLIEKPVDRDPYKDLHAHLKRKKINSLNILPLFQTLKATKQVFCKQDSHFSPLVVIDIAKAINTAVTVENGKTAIRMEQQTISFEGDLVKQTGKQYPKERFELSTLWRGDKLLSENNQSPVLLMGDSNCLIYSSGGDMHVRGAGLFEHLSMTFRQEIDLLGVKGSGIDTARVDFYRRCMNPKYLNKKKLVIWFFAAYELTESRGWKEIPVRR